MPRIFMTGASGFIGKHVVAELLTNKDNMIIAMARTEASEQSLKDAGVHTVLHGSLDDSSEQLTKLVKEEAKPDAIIHLAYNHDFSTYVKNCENEKRVVAALGAGIAGTSAPIFLASGGFAQDEDVFNADASIPRLATEFAGEALAKDSNVNVVVVRLPQVHNKEMQGFVSFFIPQYRAKGVAAYVDEGQNRLAGGYVKDVAHLYALALQKALSEPKLGAVTRYHAAAEPGVSLKTIAEACAVRLGNIPVTSITEAETPEYYGSLSPFAAKDLCLPSEKTRERLQWNPQGPTLVQSIKKEY